MNTVLLQFPHRKCMAKSLISCKYYVRHLIKKILKYFGSSSTINFSRHKIPMDTCIVACNHEKCHFIFKALENGIVLMNSSVIYTTSLHNVAFVS